MTRSRVGNKYNESGNKLKFGRNFMRAPIARGLAPGFSIPLQFQNKTFALNAMGLAIIFILFVHFHGSKNAQTMATTTRTTTYGKLLSVQAVFRYGVETVSRGCYGEGGNEMSANVYIVLRKHEMHVSVCTSPVKEKQLCSSWFEVCMPVLPYRHGARTPLSTKYWPEFDFVCDDEYPGTRLELVDETGRPDPPPYLDLVRLRLRHIQC